MTCCYLRCWTLWLATWKQLHHFYADFRLLIQKSIDTSIDGRVCHLLSMIQPLLQAWLHIAASRCLSLAQKCCKTQDISESSLASTERKSPQKDSVVQHSETAKRPSCQQQISKKAESCLNYVLSALYGHKWSRAFLLGSFWYFSLILLPHMNDVIYILIYKELQSYQHLSTSLLFSYKC